MVLYEYLTLDVPGFLSLIKEWEPTLYNTSAVINAIHDNFDKSVEPILLEAFAILYSYEKKYDIALSMYLKWVYHTKSNSERAVNWYVTF